VTLATEHVQAAAAAGAGAAGRGTTVTAAQQAASAATIAAWEGAGGPAGGTVLPADPAEYLRLVVGRKGAGAGKAVAAAVVAASADIADI
jgi:hypothetical protein